MYSRVVIFKMPKLKMECTPKIAKNFWEYYFLKWGMRNWVRLQLNTTPDNFVFDVTYISLMNNKSLFKALFRFIKDSRLKYDKKSDKFTIYSKNKDNKKEFSPDIFIIETIEKALNICEDIQEYDKDFFLVKAGGRKFFIRKRVPSDIYMVQENFLENQYEFIYPFIKNAKIIDIGANIGDTAILFAEKGASKVYAYEPHPFFYDLAIKNITLNNLSDKIGISPYGVGAKDSVLKIRDDSVFGPTGVFGSGKIEGMKEIEIKIIPLSKIIKDALGSDVLKMDCEGAEFDAILSCPSDMLRKIKVMAIEFHKNPKPIMEHLKQSGFTTEIKKENITKNGHTGLLLAVRK